MNWIYLSAYIAVSGIFFWFGYSRIGRMKAGFWIPCALACIIAIITVTVLRHFPVLEFGLIPPALGDVFDLANFIPFALLFTGIAARKTIPAFLSKEIIAIAVIIFSFGLYKASWIYVGTGVNPRHQAFSRQGYCAQSTGHTCGAASAVNFLRMYDIQTTEQEMAVLSHTTHACGVNTAQLARAVAKKAGVKSLEVDVRALDWESLSMLQKPCITFIKYTAWVDHVVVVSDVDKAREKVTFIDPIGGNLKTYEKNIFLEIWRGQVIVIK